MELSFGSWLKQRRRALNLTQEDLAQQVACSTVTVRKIESSDLVPSKDLARQFARVLNVPEAEHEAFILFARSQHTEMPATAFMTAPVPSAPLAPAPLPTHRYQLPAQLTETIGRERDTIVACSLLRLPNVRLVTLTGPPGTGKTRLSLEIADALQTEFEQGACFVPLAPLDQPGLVESAIAQALGVRESAQQSLSTALADFLHDKHLLLLLDNFEQILPAASQLTKLLAACPNLKLLITSRAVLHVQGEHEFPVPPLALPNLTQLPDPEVLTHDASIALFLQRAQAVMPTFELTAANARPIAEICVRLDGLPLALELAAARIKLLPPQALLARLEHRFEVLKSSARDVPTPSRGVTSC